jgi:predicted nucleotidyltransferase
MVQENWEKAVEKFVSKWKKKKDVIGIIICGSYITGNPTKHSDIDTIILTSKNCKWREKGNEYIDGFLFEYFANPFEQNIKYLREEHLQRKRILSHMLITGKVVFDKNEDAKKLIQKAKEYEGKKFKTCSNTTKEMSKYIIWDMKDNLEEIYNSKGEEFYMVYYVHLERLFQKYCEYLRYEKMPVHKSKRFLTDKKDFIKYKLKDFPDEEFVKLFIRAIKLKNKKDMMKNYEVITKHVLEKMSGFKIHGWRFRTPIDV